MWIYRYEPDGEIVACQFWRKDRPVPSDGDAFIIGEVEQNIGDIYVDIATRTIKTKKVYDYTQEVVGLIATISGLPEGCVVKVMGSGSVTADKDPTILEFDKAGDYTLVLSGPFGYKDEILGVSVG